jgi:hypothetical protein
VTRLPAIPSREETPEDERASYDLIAAKVALPGPNVHPAQSMTPYWTALMHTPAIASALTNLGRLIVTQAGNQGRWTSADHQFADLILSFELDYWGYLALHTPMAVRDGVRIEAIEALRDGRESDLSEDERQLVCFIRAVISGSVTDQSFAEMESRLGSLRGVIEFSMLVLLLHLHLRLKQVLDVPVMTPGDFDEMLGKLRAGTGHVPALGRQ